MSDSARENVPPTSSAPTAIECPQCDSQLRLLRPATIHTPIACCICGTTFYLQPIETAPLVEGPEGRGPRPSGPLRYAVPWMGRGAGGRVPVVPRARMAD